MTATAGFRGLYVKELKELVRERRLFVLLMAVVLLFTIPATMVDLDFLGGAGYAPNWSNALEPLVFLGPMILLLVNLTFAADAVSKERDGGTLSLVMVSPVSGGGVILSKVAFGLTVYAAIAAFFLAFYALVSLALGSAILEAVALFFTIPFLAVHVFLLGVGLVMSVLLRSSKTAVGLTLALYLPLLLLMPEEPGLGGILSEFAPRLYGWLDYNPLWMGLDTARAIGHGVAFSWGPVVASVVAGIGLMGLAYLLFERQEVTG